MRTEAKRLGLDRCDFRFSRRQVRESTGFSYEQLRVHLERLVELEYVIVHRGGRGQSFSYELSYDGAGKHGERFVVGLADVNELVRASTTTTLGGAETSLGGQKGEFGGRLGAHTGPIPGGYRPSVETRIEHQNGSKPALAVVTSSETHIREEEKHASCRTRGGVSSLAAQAARR